MEQLKLKESMSKELDSIIELLGSQNEDDKILGTILLGKMGKANIEHLFKGLCAVGKQWKIGGVLMDRVRIITINDCRFWLGGKCLNLLGNDFDIDNYPSYPALEYLNYE